MVGKLGYVTTDVNLPATTDGKTFSSSGASAPMYGDGHGVDGEGIDSLRFNNGYMCCS